jgi:lysophospholipase L1-like esterase
MGYGATDGDEFPARVAKALEHQFAADSVPIINAGLGDNGQGRVLKFLRDEAPQYEPRVVVIQLCSNDPSDNIGEHLFTLAPSGDLVEQPVPNPSFKRRAQAWAEAVPVLSYSHLVCLCKQIGSGNDALDDYSKSLTDRPDDSPATDGEKLTNALLERCMDVCDSHHWRVIMLTADFAGPLRAQVAQLCAKRNVPLVAVPPKRGRPDLYYKIDGHWNATGQQYVAKLVTDRLLELLP